MIEALIIIAGLFFVYIISCIIVLIYRRIERINPKFSVIYAIFIALLLSSVPAWTLYSTYTSFQRRGDRLLCMAMVSTYCDKWRKCNFTQECKQQIILFDESMPFDEFQEICVNKFSFKPLGDLAQNEC